MGQGSMWEGIAIGAIALLVLFWFKPGIRATLAESRKAEKDWPGFLISIAFVVLFVFFLMMIV